MIWPLTLSSSINSTSTSVTKVLSNTQMSKDVQIAINELVNMLSHSSYRCLSMNYYFKKQTIALYGVADLHSWSAESDALWAGSLMEYMNMRGAIMKLESISEPEFNEWGNVPQSLECILRGKQETYLKVLKIYEMSNKETDPDLANFLEVNYVRPMVNFIRKMGILHAQSLLVCSEGSIGEYVFNEDVKKNLLKIITVNKLVRPDKWSFSL